MQVVFVGACPDDTAVMPARIAFRIIDNVKSELFVPWLVGSKRHKRMIDNGVGHVRAFASEDNAPAFFNNNMCEMPELGLCEEGTKLGGILFAPALQDDAEALNASIHTLNGGDNALRRSLQIDDSVRESQSALSKRHTKVQVIRSEKSLPEFRAVLASPEKRKKIEERIDRR